MFRPPLVATNWIGLKTLYLKEVRRFLKVWVQTVIAPMVTILLYYTVFALALGGKVKTMGEVPFLTFLAPGLIMMAMVQNAFANTSSSMVLNKMNGTIVDILMPPLSVGEFAIAFVMGGVTRGLLIGTALFPFAVFFIGSTALHLFYLIFYAVSGCMMLSLLGIVSGIWADKFDHMAGINNFIIVPLTFLSGTFYAISVLPPEWQFIAHLNPFFYMIDGFRYGLIGYTDGTLGTGMLVMIGVNLLLWIVLLRMLHSGYKLKS